MCWALTSASETRAGIARALPGAWTNAIAVASNGPKLLPRPTRSITRPDADSCHRLLQRVELGGRAPGSGRRGRADGGLEELAPAAELVEAPLRPGKAVHHRLPGLERRQGARLSGGARSDLEEEGVGL